MPWEKDQGKINDWVMGMLNGFLKESSYSELKRKAENRKKWRLWKSRACLTAEH